MMNSINVRGTVEMYMWMRTVSRSWYSQTGVPRSKMMFRQTRMICYSTYFITMRRRFPGIPRRDITTEI